MAQEPDPDLAMVELDADECWALLRTADVGRLAVLTADGPDIFPINFAIDHGTVVFRTAEGTKLEASTHGARVAFEVDGLDVAAGTAWSVVMKARGEAVAQLEELVDTVDLPLFPWQASPKPRFVRLVPDAVTGRRFRVVPHSTWTPPTGPRTHSPD